jgi:hypothetical protein
MRCAGGHSTASNVTVVTSGPWGEACGTFRPVNGGGSATLGGPDPDDVTSSAGLRQADGSRTGTSSSASSPRMRAPISSRIGRTASTPFPAGSSSAQSR